MSFITNMSIARRLFFAVAMAALIPAIIIAVLGGSYISTLNSVNETVQKSDDAVKLATDQQADLLRMNALLAAAGPTNPNSFSENVQISQEVSSLTSDFNNKLALYTQNYQITTSDNMKSVRDVLQNNGLGLQVPVSQHSMIFIVALQWREYESSQNVVLQDLQQKAGLGKLSDDLANANLFYLPLKGNLDNLVGLTESISQSIAQVNASQTTTILIGTIFAFFLSTLVVFAIGYLVNLTITRPLRQLAVLTRRISKGETNVRATIGGHDEIYLVASSMNQMLDNIVHLMQETRFQHDILKSRVEQLISEVSGIGSGDLSIKANVTADALGVLADSFNYMVGELASLVIRVKMVAREVEKLTATTLNRMTSLVDIGDRQIEQMAASAREVEQMADETRQVAERARVLSNIALETRQTAQGGRNAVHQVVEGMGRIHENMQLTAGKVQLLGESSQEITNIVTVISNIAYQTNRLALDAAVQAAMAGANGKAFGAVASDIRRLAEQTKQQAGMIAHIVRTVNENISGASASMRDTERETASGAKLGQDAGKALELIFAAVEQQAKEIASIDKMAAHQLDASKGVVRGMQTMSEATRHSSASTRDASQNMWRLAHLVKQLRTSVEAFKLPNEQVRYIDRHSGSLVEPSSPHTSGLR